MESLGDLIMKCAFSTVLVAVAIWIASHVRGNWKR